MIDDRDVWQAALLIVKRYGDDAMLEAVRRHVRSYWQSSDCRNCSSP